MLFWILLGCSLTLNVSLGWISYQLSVAAHDLIEACRAMYQPRYEDEAARDAAEAMHWDRKIDEARES